MQILDVYDKPATKDNETRVSFAVVQGVGTLSSTGPVRVQAGVASVTLTSSTPGEVKVMASVENPRWGLVADVRVKAPTQNP